MTRIDPRRWALVTSNAERRVVRRFERLGLPLPHVVIDSASTARGKPAADPYRMAAARLRVASEDSLVIEDSASGVQAGLAAGMTVWSVNGAGAVPGAHRHFPTLADAVPEVLAWSRSEQRCSNGGSARP